MIGCPSCHVDIGPMKTRHIWSIFVFFQVFWDRVSWNFSFLYFDWFMKYNENYRPIVCPEPTLLVLIGIWIENRFSQPMIWAEVVGFDWLQISYLFWWRGLTNPLAMCWTWVFNAIWLVHILEENVLTNKNYLFMWIVNVDQSHVRERKRHLWVWQIVASW